MPEKLGPKTAIVSLSEMGTNCWLPKRFIEGGSRCERVFTCSYPEKANCQAVKVEIKYLRDRQTRLHNSFVNIDRTIGMLQNMLKK